MSLRKIDESNVDVEPYAFALNNASLIREIIRDHFRPRSNFEWEKFFFSNFFLSFDDGEPRDPSFRIDKPSRDFPAKTKRGRSRRTSIKQFARGGKGGREMGGGPINLKALLCTIPWRDSHRRRCRRDVIRQGGGGGVPGEDFHPFAGIIRASLSRKEWKFVLEPIFLPEKEECVCG